MEPVHIDKKEEIPEGWMFVVEIGENADKLGFAVILEKKYWQELTQGHISPEDLIKKTFHFLLSREPKMLIERRFNLRDIRDYFPDYELFVRVKKS